MSVVDYVCTHCQHRFQAEQRDVLECPKCFWSSSVKELSEVEDEKKNTSSRASQKNKTPVAFNISFMTPLIKWIVVVLAVGMLVFALMKFLGRDKSADTQTISLKAPSAKSKEALKHSEPLQPSESQQNVLKRRQQISEKRDPGPEEIKILEAHAEFRTGSVERLPSQPWTLESFQNMVAQQETLYKLPFAKSYKRQLFTHFEEKYLPSVALYESGDILRTRNQWVEALVIPLYSDNLQKHRAVGLTMLKPFINDTLSKIGAANSILVDRGIRAKEAQLTQTYDSLFADLKAKNWTAALDKMNQLTTMISQLENPEMLKITPPVYPPAISAVDSDIRFPLIELLNAPTPPVADLGSLKADLMSKKQVVSGYLSGTLDAVKKTYGSAVDAIERKQWKEAVRLLKEIRFPPALVSDAKEKIKIIEDFYLN